MSVPEISQTDMSNVHTYENSIRRITAARNRMLESMLQRYEQGAAVEPGAFDLEVVQEFGKGSKTIVIKVL